LDTDAYLIRIQRDTSGVSISDLTLYGPKLHGAIFAWFHTGLHLHHVRIKNFRWSGVRTFGMSKAKIHDCEFLSAGGRWDKGQPGVKGGITGGGIFACWMSDSEICHNRFAFVPERNGPEDEYYGIKVRQGIRTHVHHNTILANFSMEFPFENDEDNEIDHNVCHGTISIPKYAGGAVPKSGRTFHIHHNWFKDSYSIEFVRNGVEIDHNLFDFDPKADHGNLIAAFGDVDAPGPVSFHNNLVQNPGRGVAWINEVFQRFEVRNNHIITRTTTTPRTEGLFGFNPKCDFSTIRIADNIIECQGTPRPLLRCEESYDSVVENNLLKNVSDITKYENRKADRSPGLVRPLKFTCGVQGEFTVDGWNVFETTSGTQVRVPPAQPNESTVPR
jgi:nitrous oxidase accessory protein